MPDRRKKIARDVETAFRDAVRAAGGTATLRQGMGERVEARDVARDIVTGTASNFVIQQAKDALCRRGYSTSVTCQPRGGNQVDFIFDVNSRRVIVGVQITF